MAEKLIDRLRDVSWRGRTLSQAELEIWHETCCLAAKEIERLQAIEQAAHGMASTVSEFLWEYKTVIVNNLGGEMIERIEVENKILREAAAVEGGES